MLSASNPHDLLCNLRVNTPVFDRARKVQDYLVQSSESPVLPNGALARSLVSDGVVNRSVVINKKHRKSLSCNATTIGAEQRKCPSNTFTENFVQVRPTC